MKKLVVAGGGTGGHVLAGVAIADAWRSTYGEGSVSFVGAVGGIEERLVPRAGYPLEVVALGSLKGASVFKRLNTLSKIPAALLKSARILLRDRPEAVIGVGGYASGPLVLMARLIGVAHVAILEQNAAPGLTNRILSRFCHRIFSAFPGLEGQFPGRSLTVTGNPVRSVFKAAPSASREPFVIFVFGGSQGAKGINSLVLESLPLLGDLKDGLRLVHQTGEADYDRVVQGYATAGWSARIEKFIYDMPETYESASLLVCRAGSGTLSEIAAVGRASVLIPFPYASDNHQEKNARIFEKAGAGTVLVQFKSQASDLVAIIRRAVSEPAWVESMERAARTFHRPEAAQMLVRQLAGENIQ